MNTLLRRCVQCPQEQPVCPSCPSGQQCAYQIQTCDFCASYSCIPNQTGTSSVSGGSSTSAVGPIAGGVAGGIAVIAVAVYFVWRFCIKKRKQEFDESMEWPDESPGVEKGMDQFSIARERRASTNTVGSFASTVYTRASNIIQIAYIPGVTNRSVDSSPELIPPVPPIPAMSPNSSIATSPHTPSQDQFFFSPGNLRDSSYSDFSRRTSMARSVARSSVATTIYRNNAIVSPVPAQTVTRAKAVPVSVKTSGKNSPNLSRAASSRTQTPPMPTGQVKQDQTLLNTQSSIVGRIAVPKQVTVTRSSSKSHPSMQEIHELSGDEFSVLSAERRSANASPQHTNDASTFDDASSDEEQSPVAGTSLIPPHKRHSDAATEFQDDSPISTEGLAGFKGTSPVSFSAPFVNSSPAKSAKPAHKKSPSLNQIIEEATRKATQDPRHGGLGSYKDEDPDSGPFSDAHIVEAP